MLLRIGHVQTLVVGIQRGFQIDTVAPIDLPFFFFRHVVAEFFKGSISGIHVIAANGHAAPAIPVVVFALLGLYHAVRQVGCLYLHIVLFVCGGHRAVLSAVLTLQLRLVSIFTHLVIFQAIENPCKYRSTKGQCGRCHSYGQPFLRNVASGFSISGKHIRFCQLLFYLLFDHLPHALRHVREITVHIF